MQSSARDRKQISEIRCPNINGLPIHIVRMLHQSFADIVQMRRSIESADHWVATGREAAIEGMDLLARLKAEGF
jgi:hypothetical protein